LVLDVFPATNLDIVQGVDCWALGHATASVFHMMRILETGLRWIAEDCDVPFEVESWHHY
jgi:hypothetical protein